MRVNQELGRQWMGTGRKQQGSVSQKVGYAFWGTADSLMVHCHPCGDAQNMVPDVSS